MWRLRAAAGLSLLLLLLLWPPVSFAAGTASRVVIPVSSVRLSDGAIRYAVPVSIGGSAPINAMLDTGSFGLRLLQGAVPPSDYADTGIQRVFAFGGGVALRGTLAEAPVAIGSASTGAPIYFQVVHSVGCIARRPQCPAARLSGADFRIGGDGLAGQGFDAILGLSLWRPPVALAAINPLYFIGDRSWILILPMPGQSQGELIVNPTAEERSGFHMTSVPEATTPGARPKLLNAMVPLCGSSREARSGSCPMVKLDTGSRDGLQPYYTYAVLYDAQRGMIGFKPRGALR